MNKQMPVILSGFLVLVALPAILAGLSFTVGLDVPYALRLDMWTLPWTYAAGVVLLAFLLDVRRSQGAWQALPYTAWAAMLALLALSLAHRQWDVASKELFDIQLYRSLLAVGVGLAAYYGMARYQGAFARPVYGVLAFSIFMLVPALLAFIYVQAPDDSGAALVGWQLPGFGAVRLFGIALEVGIVVIAGGIVGQQGRGGRRVALWLVLTALWAAVFWTGGRGAVVSILAAALVLSMARPDLCKPLWRVLLATAVAGAVLSLGVRVPADSSFGLLNMFFKSTRSGVDAISSGRVDRWLGALTLILDKPWFGHGLGQFPNLWPKFAEFDLRRVGAPPLPDYFLAYRTVHNIVLDIFLAWGFAGGALCLWLLLKGWAKSFMRLRTRSSSLRVPAFLGLNVLLVHSLLAGVYAVPFGLFYMALFFGICLAPNSAQNENTNG